MANIKVSELPAASAASTSQEFEVNDSGTSKKVTGSQIKSFVKNGLVLSDITNVTASATELNVLDGITATTARLNQLTANSFTDISVKAGGGTEGGQINVRNPGDTSTGLLIDVSSADTGRIYSTTNNSNLLLGQLGGTNGTVSIVTAGNTRLFFDGSGNVTGTSIATQAEAQAGAANNKLMTPERVAQAIPAKLNATGSAPIYACRAWVNFNGTGTVAIRASGNVSSITDNGVGSYTVNFTTAMPDANYAAAGGGEQTNSSVGIRLLSTTSLICEFWDTSNVKRDASTLTLAVFR